METKFVKIRSAKDIIISSLLVISGCILVVLPLGTGVNIGGATLIVTGLILALTLRSAYRDSSSAEKYYKRELCFKQEYKATILKSISEQPSLVDVSQNGNGQALRLDIYYSKSAGDAYIQLFEYIPHQYKPCSKIYVYEIERIKNLIS